VAQITVKFYTIWRAFLNIDQTELDASSVADAMDQIESAYQKSFEEKCRQHGIAFQEIRAMSVILLNGRSTNKENLAAAYLKDGDTIHLFPQVMGG
jgi:molybdopterin converting factor small subunit